MTGGAIVELRPGPYGGIQDRRALDDRKKSSTGTTIVLSIGEMDRMVRAAAVRSGDKSPNAVRSMTTNKSQRRYGVRDCRVSGGDK